MHINFDDENLLVDNIQIFLKESINPDLSLSGVYDQDTHETLIKYLKTPNTATVYEIKQLMHDNFVFREVNPPHKVVDGGGLINFDNDMTPYEIHYYTKPTNTYYNGGVKFISEYIDKVSEFVSNYGWSVSQYSSFGTGNEYAGRTRAQFTLRKTGIDNVFPNKEVLPMINLFSGKYLYNKCFIANDGAFDADIIQPNPNYKIAIIPCSDGDTFTITHGYSVACEIAITYTTKSISELKTDMTDLREVNQESAILNRLDSSVKGPVYPGDFEYYTVPNNSNSRYLLVQMPYRDDLTSYQTQKITVKLGDINLDGIVDMNDVNLLNSWVTAKEQNLPEPFSLTGTSLIAANVTRDVDLDGNPIIDRNDVTVLRIAVEQGKTDALGTQEYEQPIRVSSYELDRLLVMYGDLSKNEDLNIPADQFWISPWAVHEQFLEYFLKRVIHKYSEIEDISWLQTNIRKLYPDYSYKYTGYYDSEDDYLTEDHIDYDTISGTYKYYRGDLYSGWRVESYDNLKTGKFICDEASSKNMYIEDSRIYIDGVFDGRVVLDNGKIATQLAENSLKSLVRKFQLQCNKQLEANGILSEDRLKWTFGNFTVDTDRELTRVLNSDITYITGAFR